MSLSRRRTRTKRGAVLGAALAAVLLALAVPAQAAPGDDPAWAAPGTAGAGAPPLPAVRAAAWVVADADTGAVLAEKDAHTGYAPASTLKVLTALSLLPVVPPSTTVVPTREDVAVDGSKVGLLAGVPYTGEQLYTALFLVSGNDAANALARAAGGTEQAVARMNAEAQRLGATGTRAVNPHGLDAPGQVSTAYDLAVLARAGLDTPDIARWGGTQRGTMPRGPGQPPFEIANHNKLLGSYPGAIGLKNGYTIASQASYIGAAQRGGHRLVVTLMRATPSFWKDAEGLLDWGFAAEAAGAPPVERLPSATAAAPAGKPAAGKPAAVRGRAVPAAVRRGDGALPGGPEQVAGGLLVAAATGAVLPWHRRRPVRSRRP